MQSLETNHDHEISPARSDQQNVPLTNLRAAQAHEHAALYCSIESYDAFTLHLVPRA